MPSSFPLRLALPLSALGLALLLTPPAAHGQAAAPNYRLELRGAPFTPPANIEDFFSPAAEPTDISGGVYYRMVQFWELPTKERRARLEQSWHTRLLDYLPKNTYVVAFPASFNRQLLMGYNVRSVFQLTPEQRLHPQLRTGTVPAHALRPGGLVEVLLETIAADAAPDPAALRAATQAALIAAGAQELVAPDPAAPHRLRARVPLSKVRAVAAVPLLLSMEPVPAPPQREDRPGRSSHRANYLDADYPLGRHYNGEGVRVALGDDGIVGEHIDYTGRFEQSRVTSDNGAHGDHCAGIIAGAGNLDPRQRGMATAASVSVYDPFENIDSAPVDFDTMGVRITSTSYGDGCHAGYTFSAQSVDRQTRQRPALLHVFSAGNSGTSNCGFLTGWGNITGGNKSGKNVLAVGAVDRLDNLADFSSRGPTADGRIKPDICAVGVDVNSTLPTNRYGSNTGTSMACPGMAGTAAQLYQLWRARHNGQDPAAALIKAAVLGTADDLGETGPDFQYGFGRLNARRAALALEGEHFFADSVDQGDLRSFALTVPAGTQQVRVLTHWTDYEGAVLAGRALVNDLDALLITPAGDTLRPWVLDPRPNLATIGLPATRGRDSLNNSELITLDAPAPGVYHLLVKGTGVAQGVQRFYSVYEVVSDSITVTYPFGGESFALADTEIIRWDAFGDAGRFDISLSEDGVTWQSIGSVAGTQRAYQWQPNVARLGQLLRVRVQRGAVAGYSVQPFSVQPSPTNLRVTRVCPDSTTFEWNPVTSAVRYDVYRLGATTMDSIGSSTTARFVLPGTDPRATDWLSVRAVRANGARSNRALAIRRAPGIVNCVMALDASLVRIVSPTAGTTLACGPVQPRPVQLELTNAGLQALPRGGRAFYQLDNNPVQTDSLPAALLPGTGTFFTFSTPVTLSAAGTHRLRAWVSLPGDGNRYNDTATIQLALAAGTISAVPYTQNVDNWQRCASASDCETTVCALGNGWRNAPNGTGDDIDWRVNSGLTPSVGTGPDLDHTLGTGAGKYLYLEPSNGCFGKTAVLTSPCFDLTADTVAREFTFWYHAFGADIGALHVDVLPDSGAAVTDAIPPIQGNQGNQWRQARVALAPFRGRMVVVRLRGITGADFEGDLALDDFAVAAAPVQGLRADAAAFAARLALAPNPTTGVVQLARPDLTDGPLTVTVLDMHGRTVARQALNGLNTSLNLGTSPAGTYLVRVVSAHTSVVRRLVVTR